METTAPHHYSLTTQQYNMVNSINRQYSTAQCSTVVQYGISHETDADSFLMDQRLSVFNLMIVVVSNKSNRLSLIFSTVKFKPKRGWVSGRWLWCSVQSSGWISLEKPKPHQSTIHLDSTLQFRYFTGQYSTGQAMTWHEMTWYELHACKYISITRSINIEHLD